MTPLTASPLTVAFAAGVLSFLSHCVLPLIPSYVGYLTGLTAEQVAERRGLALLHALWFVAGFAVVFVALGATASALGSLFRDSRVWLPRAGGGFPVILGLSLPGAPRVSVLLRERPFTLAREPV